MLLRSLGSHCGVSIAAASVAGAAAWAEGDNVPTALEAFDLHDVRLGQGPCQVAQEANRRYLHELDADRLLYTVRMTAGLETPGEPLGGWEAPDSIHRGNFIGHYLSACALMVASTGDEELKAKADYIVAELARCQEAHGNGYLLAFPQELWDRFERLEETQYLPYYKVHKFMAGLLDMYQLCENEQALEVAKGIAGYFKGRTGKLGVHQMNRILESEFGGMPEGLYNLHAVTGDPSHLELAHRFDHMAFLAPLAFEHDSLSLIHANTQVPKILGAARRYELTGDERYRTITCYFWDRITKTRSYATGGSTHGEIWSEPNQLAHTLASNNQECCVTHNMLKVTRYLLRWTGDPAYGDYYERAFWNGIMGTQHPETGMLIYYLPLATGHTKQFGTPYDSFWCCYGTGIESFAKLGDSIYFHDDEGSPAVYVNLFIASTVNWQEKGIRLEQLTNFPEEESTALVFHVAEPVRLGLYVRVPYWATNGIEVELNGEPLDVDAEPTSFLTIEREWQDGDRVRIRMPMALHTHPMADDPELMAFMYGPLVLAGLTKEDVYFPADATDLESWVTPVEGQPLTFRAKAALRQAQGRPRRSGGHPERTRGPAETEVSLIPLYRVIEQAYGVYWLVTPEGGPPADHGGRDAQGYRAGRRRW